MDNSIFRSFHKLLRVDTRDYPEVAIREALLNSLVHREYGTSASTLISIYTDRIEFTSIGGLVTDISLADIMMGVSVCRNARLANVFYRLELIEAYGTGIQKIFKSYEDTSKKPRIETSDNAFKVTLPNLNVKNDDLKQLTHIQSDQDKVIDLALKQGFVTRKNIEKLLSIGQTTSGRLLKQMVESGHLVLNGKGRNTHYTLPK